MTHHVIVRSSAQKELANIAFWYERQKTGLGGYFILCFDAAVESLCRYPDMYPRIYGEYRRVLVKKFPVGLFYLVRNDVVSVVYVSDLRRDPEAIEHMLK